jgi:metal-dependent amidase/aminoacylase/carboxypeptidase family protein
LISNHGICIFVPPALAQVAPAFFFALGTQKPGMPSGIYHATNFVADDSAIPVGIRAMTEVLLEYLRTTPIH